MPKILVAGISEKHSSTIPDVLRMAGYEVLETADSRTAFQFVLEQTPALIVAKSNLPHLDGLGFLHIIRKHAQFALTPLIFLFETEGWDEVRRMMTAGADDFLFTTCTDAELLYVVESRLKRVALVKDFLKQSTPVPEAGSALQERQVMEELLQGRNLHRYGKSQLIYSEGQSPKFLFYIKNGKVRLLKSSTDGKDLVTDLCGEGDFIGHTALIQNTHYRESAESIDGAELILVPRSEFQQLLRGNINFSYKINMILANALTSKNSHLVGIAYHSLRQKVAEALLLVKRKYAPAQQENFAIQMNREVLANIAGTAKESLIRTLSEFKTERLIEVGVDGHIRIVNEKKLQLLAE